MGVAGFVAVAKTPGQSSEIAGVEGDDVITGAGAEGFAAGGAGEGVADLTRACLT